MQIVTGSNFLKWSLVPGATDYEAEVLDMADQRVVLTGTPTPDPQIQLSFLFTGVPFGSYKLRARGKNSFGPGAWSASVEVEYVSLPAPENIWIE